MEELTPAPAAYRYLLRRKLADATRRIQWTYSIFWIFSPFQQVLVWGEGYLNGADSTELCLRRSWQLQELFVAMNANRGMTEQSSEASAGNAVSPRDLTMTERFYMCSMACSFAAGAGLPGSTFAGKRHVWHCITGEGDTRVSIRAPFAQRAQIQTIVCIPASDGVVEFGTTALVEENAHLLQQMHSVFSENPAIHPARIGSNRARDMPSRSYKRSSGFKIWSAVPLAPHRQQFLQSHRQRMLKTAVLTIPRLYAVKEAHDIEEFSTRAGEQTSDLRESQRSSRDAHVKSERRRREKLRNAFVTLRRLIPRAKKPDKVSLLEDAIEYVKDLQRQVEELESSRSEFEQASIKQHVEVIVEKRIAVLKISCAWQDGLLINILQRMIGFQLEVVDATARVSNGVLQAKVKAKITSSYEDNEKKMVEIQTTVLSAIEEMLSNKVAASQ